MTGLSGVFFAPEIKIKERSTVDAFCKPINIRIYSAPPPVRMRLVVYEMVYWEGPQQPDVVDRWSELKRYRSPYDANDSFTFTVGTKPMQVDEVLTMIRRHFHEIVLSDRECRDKDVGLDRLMRLNEKEYQVSDVNDIGFKVFDVHHIDTIRLSRNKEHFISSRKLRYHATISATEKQYNFDDQYITAPLPYVDHRDLHKKALSHLRTKETQQKLSIVL